MAEPAAYDPAADRPGDPPWLAHIRAVLAGTLSHPVLAGGTYAVDIGRLVTAVDRLTRALDDRTCQYQESVTDPGTCAWCYTSQADPRHRGAAKVLREAGDG